MNNQEIEQAIKAKGPTAPRVTLQQVEDAIMAVQYHVFFGTTLTVCAITLRNGFTVTGESACTSLENFDAQLGQVMAREKAVQKIWELEGYALRERLHANPIG